MDGGSSNLLEVPAGNLQPGMYVAELDRPWLDTPFAVQGFYIRDRSDVDVVAKHCAYVFVDPRRHNRDFQKAASDSGTKAARKDATSLKREIPMAKMQLESASEAMRKVFEKLRSGRHLDLKVMQQVIDPLVSSVLRNSEALAALVRMKAKGDYLFNHSIANAVWSSVLGRQLGLGRDQLKRLALGAAVVDIGMTRLDDSMTSSTAEFTVAQRELVRGHVQMGVDILSRTEGTHSDVKAIVLAHHERFDGSGYPAGVSGMDIPLFARIVGLVDSYDAMISTRPHVGARSSFEAIQELADLKGGLFQAELVEQFMQAIGLFPTGSVIELNTGEVGVVVAQNALRRLRPKVVVILDQDKQRHAKLVVVDLGKYGSENAGSDLWINRELEVGAYGIRPDEYFL
ncbi:MAG: HD-GYP domain-containing protein [Pseudomonadales bacterium]|nr:HD-GYP domain-containing protein [Pseudomonadales bacterium]